MIAGSGLAGWLVGLANIGAVTKRASEGLNQNWAAVSEQDPELQTLEISMRGTCNCVLPATNILAKTNDCEY